MVSQKVSPSSYVFPYPFLGDFAQNDVLRQALSDHLTQILPISLYPFLSLGLDFLLADSWLAHTGLEWIVDLLLLEGSCRCAGCVRTRVCVCVRACTCGCCYADIPNLNLHEEVPKGEWVPTN